MKRGRDDGVALLVAIALVVAVSALSSALILWTMTEVQVARSFGLGVEGRYAAGAAAERALIDLAASPDWNAVLDGSTISTFNDGPPGGRRPLADRTSIDLDAVRNLANCAHASPCSESELDAITSERPWGPNNPRWRLFAYGPLRDVASPPVDSPFYLVVLVGDDPTERDGNPRHDDGRVMEEGAGIIQVRGEAFGPRGSHRAVALTIARAIGAAPGPSTLRVIAWRGID